MSRRLGSRRRWRLTKSIEVEIFGQRYTIKGEADEAYVKELASYVDEQMRSMGQGMKTATLAKIAVLTAINISHELFEIKRLRESEAAEADQQVLSLMETIEAQLPAGGGI